MRLMRLRPLSCCNGAGAEQGSPILVQSLR